jgi:hypothetical protein
MPGVYGAPPALAACERGRRARKTTTMASSTVAPSATVPLDRLRRMSAAPPALCLLAPLVSVLLFEEQRAGGARPADGGAMPLCLAHDTAERVAAVVDLAGPY